MLIRQILLLATALDKIGLSKEAKLLDDLAFKVASKEKWMQVAIEKKDRGKFAKWCKRKGYKGVCQSCIDDAINSGGKAAKMANFAINVSNGKYKHPNANKK